MKLVIDISREDYELVRDKDEFSLTELADILNTISKGTPLPKGHGDLIDRDSLELDSDWSDYYDGFSAYSESQVRLAPTIIEAESEE